MNEHDTAVGMQAPMQVGNSDPQSVGSVTLRHVAHRRTRRPNEWSSADLRLLRELALSGQPLDAIAATLRRTTSAVRNKAGMHGISLKGRR